MQARSGPLFDFLDELEVSLRKFLPHRSTLARQKAASLAFERDRRPGTMSADIDYAENLDIKETREAQSEHWSTNQCTLFLGVWQWLDVGSWNLTVGGLAEGAEVTAGGEVAGAPRRPGSFWAKVISPPSRAMGAAEDSYEVEDAAGVKHTLGRSQLRLRVFVKQCHTGVTGDKKHDRYPRPCSFCLIGPYIFVTATA